ncbi:MAG: GIY-YIG nuclease family protein, partial [Flavobacteriaceae bacterium]|nr:GIY-YIG nuclease family protein [Flavobacteriaceae bacterium]
MSHCCYILHSKQLDRFYIGYTSDLKKRLDFHKTSSADKYTYNGKDWELYFSIACENKAQALAIEAHIKRMKSKKYILNLVKYPELVSKLLIRYKDG